MNPELVAHAAELISQADALVIAAGAGMGVDSGLPDFRGNTGFWKAYPVLAKVGLDFTRKGDRTFCNVVDVEGEKLLVNVAFKK